MMDWREAIEHDAQDDTMAPPEEYQRLAQDLAHAEGLHLAARTLGARGGAAGRGAAKSRGDSEHYRALRAEAVSLHVGAQRQDSEWLAGVWAADNRLAWSSEPTSYPTQSAARVAAREAKSRLIAGEITPHTISLRGKRLR